MRTDTFRTPPTVTVDQHAPGGFDGVRGVRWKPGLAGRDNLVTGAPYTGSMGTDAAARMLQREGINYTTVDVSPARKVRKSLEAQGLPASHTDVRDWKQQQRRDIVDFVRTATTADPQLHVMLHSRVNSQGEYERDMHGTIHALERAGLGDHVAGVMIGEHELDDPKEYLHLARSVAGSINHADFDGNGRPDHWLRRDGRGLTVQGGGFGVDFTGIRDAARSTRFFSKMEHQAGRFAFAFKFFRPSGLDAPDGDTEADWEQYARSGLGLDELEQTVHAARRRHPDLASVIFVGDSGDGEQAIRSRRDGAGDAITSALGTIFRDNGWTGSLLGQPLDARDAAAGAASVGRGMWSPDGTREQDSLAWHRQWVQAVTAGT